jgi:hypothetical protein
MAVESLSGVALGRIVIGKPPFFNAVRIFSTSGRQSNDRFGIKE